MRIYRIHILLLFALLLCGCGGSRQKNETGKFQALPFPEVAVPGMMNDRNDVMEYMSMNYWNGITDPSREYPCDSLLVSGVKIGDVEQRFVGWASALWNLPFDKAEDAVARLYDRVVACERKNSTSNVFETFNDLMARCLYDPNSPIRNEDLYHTYVRRLASYEGLDPAMKGKYEFEIRMTGMNRAGTVAADFRFSDRNGRMRTLHGVSAPMTLLFFSNPGCEACLEIINVLKGEPKIAEMISSGKLAVLNIYIDEDLQAWKEYMPVYPEEWYNGFDPDLVLRNDSIYNIRAIPSLYLLDGEKRVILKDAHESRIFEVLLNMVEN